MWPMQPQAPPSIGLVPQGWLCQASDCTFSHTISHLLLAKRLHDWNEKPKANFICIDQGTSQCTPSQSMLPYCTRSMFTTAQDWHSQNQPTCSLGFTFNFRGLQNCLCNHLDWPTTNQSTRSALIGWMVAKTTNPIQAAQSMEWGVLLIIIMKKKKSIPHYGSGYSSSVTHFIMHFSMMSSLEH